MGAAADGLLKQGQTARRVHGANNRRLTSFLLCAIFLTAIVVVVVAAMVGQSTVALCVGLVSAAFFAGMLS